MLALNAELKNKCILVTGAAEFIGSNLVTPLLRASESLSAGCKFTRTGGRSIFDLPSGCVYGIEY